MAFRLVLSGIRSIPLKFFRMKDSRESVPILIVDGNPDSRSDFKRILQKRNYLVSEARSGPECLSLVQKQEFALILLNNDFSSPDALEITGLIRNESSYGTNPIILITSPNQNHDWVKKAYDAGVVDFLADPVDTHIFQAKISIFADLFRARKKIENQTDIIRSLEKEERNSILENALDAVINMNESGLITYWNHQAEEIFGWQKNEAIGKKLSETIIPPAYRKKHEEGLRYFLKTGIGPILNRRLEIIAIKKDNSEFPVELTVAPIRKKGHYIFSAFLRDISARKAEQLRIKTSEENLRQAVKARDDFISLCSHELKTPLTSMRIHFQLAKKLYDEGSLKVFSREAVKTRIDIANRQIDRMTKLIDNMLEVSGIASGKLQFDSTAVDLHGLIIDILHKFHPQAEEAHIEMDFKTDYSHPVILGDFNRLEQAINNLLANAVKYGKGKPVDIVLNSLGTEAFLSITDHGIGIEEENLDRIFRKYERAISPHEISGLGLGLYISRQIIEGHMGNLSVKSKKGEGSTFTIRLPRWEAPAQLSH